MTQAERTDTDDDAAERGAGGADARAPGGGDVNVEQLADRVYRLMLAEVRRERARAGGLARRRHQ